jgi:hypothetical protein
VAAVPGFDFDTFGFEPAAVLSAAVKPKSTDDDEDDEEKTRTQPITSNDRSGLNKLLRSRMRYLDIILYEIDVKKNYWIKKKSMMMRRRNGLECRRPSRNKNTYNTIIAGIALLCLQDSSVRVCHLR